MSTARRILIVGGVAGGASCAARLRRMDEHAEIVMFEKGPFVSFANCGLPYHVGGVIADEAKLLVATPEFLRSRFRIDVRTGHEVTRIDREAHTIEAANVLTGEVSEEGYDKLVLAPGSLPVRPPIPGIDLPGIFQVRTIPDVRAIREWIALHPVQRAVIVGGGYIGLEMAENLVHLGLETTILERLGQVMPPLDAEMAEPVHRHLRDKGVDLRLETEVTAFKSLPEGLSVVTAAGETIEAGLVILSIGGRPNADLARGAGLRLGRHGGIRVDEKMRTSDPDIYAVGDAVEVMDAVTGLWTLLPLAGPANRQGRIAADAITGREARFRGVQGTAVCGGLGLTIAMTGQGEKGLVRAGVPFEKVYLFPGHHVGYYPGAEPIHLKVLFRPSTGRLLGAQAVGKAGVEKRMDVLSAMIQMNATVYDLEEAELCYAPQYGAAKDPVNLAGFIAANHLRGYAPLARWEDVLEGPDEKPFILDVREPAEFAAGHAEGATNIPWSALRDRIVELPRDRPIYAHCGVGLRSHNAVRILRQHGFDARNLAGGFKQHQIQRHNPSKP
ncbi:FAD-dependent oxidoreductase [Candidatus Poribacteria bacterium]|nr:FAD-dependent oxidoreductase [Candidatus Poribacteria bacterium]